MNDRLKRELGVGGATLLGLGSMLGTGVFVSLAIAAGITGPSVVLAVTLAAGVAVCNALSSAQLAAAHPVSGGTYEYGYTFLTPVLGFTAGWMFMLAKSASAATAALGVVGYALNVTGLDVGSAATWLAPAVVLLLTAIVIAGVRRTTTVNALIVSVTLVSLLFFVGSSIRFFRVSAFSQFFNPEAGRMPLPAFLYATALSFVAYTGYGRIATLGEEVRDPQTTIPRAVAATVVVTAILYVLVAGSSVSIMGTEALAASARTTAAPLELAAERSAGSVGRVVLAVGAITALLGVLLNLILGLSRVLLAMARRGDMPRLFSKLNTTNNPQNAVIAVGLLIALLTLIGDIRLSWSFSAVTVLTYYAIANLSALRVPRVKRLYPRWISVVGLVGCLSLLVFVDLPVMLVGLGMAGVGLIWFAAARAIRK